MNVRCQRLAAATAVAVFAALVPWQSANAQGSTTSRVFSTQAVAVTAHDARVVIETDFDVRPTGASSIEAHNTAYAYARCRDCRSVAVSFQIIVIKSAAPDVIATNHAVAVNDRCDQCESLALGYQFVVVAPAAHLSGPGRARLAELRGQLARLERDEPPDSEIQRQVQNLAAQVDQVLTTELQTRAKIKTRVAHTRS